MRTLDGLFKAFPLDTVLDKYHITNEERKTIIDILNIEWDFFDNIPGQSGRAHCQDEALTFVVMRLAQYLTLSRRSRISILQDLESAERENRNTITEKYARMMEKTDPESFKNQWEGKLPVFSAVKSSLMRSISRYLDEFCSETMDRLPETHSKSRPILSAPGAVSSMDYFISEISSYSAKTLNSLIDDLKLYKTNGKNIVEDIFMNTVIIQNAVGRKM